MVSLGLNELTRFFNLDEDMNVSGSNKPEQWDQVYNRIWWLYKFTLVEQYEQLVLPIDH